MNDIQFSALNIEPEPRPEQRVIFQNDHIQILNDQDEPWRCFVYTSPDGDGNYSTWAGNPRLTDMADMALALLAEYRAQN